VVDADVAVGRAHQRFDANGALTHDDLREQFDDVAQALVAAVALREPVAA
jgi:hypothetical protein